MPPLAVALVGVRLVQPSLELDRRGHRRGDVDLGEEVVLHGAFRQHGILEKIAVHGGASTRVRTPMWVYCIRPHRSTTYLLAASIVRAKGSLQIGRACASGDENGCAFADACSIEAHRDQGGARSRLGLACNQGIWLARFYWANAATADPAAPPQEIKRAYDLACGRSSPAQSLAYTRLAVRDRSAGEACC